MSEKSRHLTTVLCSIFAVSMILCACASPEMPRGMAGNTGTVNPGVTKEIFGKTADGKEIELVTLRNTNGLKARIMTYGAILISLHVPDKYGRLDDIVLGFDSAEEYMSEKYISGCPYFGAIAGRYGNRIAKGKFSLDGTEYTLATNDGDNHMHGGVIGFDKVLWTVEEMFEKKTEVSAVFSYTSKDGEEGYPGNLKCSVTFSLTNNNELVIEYSATTDKSTVVNLVNHSYFNLAGQGKRDILEHELVINADYFTPIDSGLIPTGELRPVADTNMDFRVATEIGKRIDYDIEDEDVDMQLVYGKGYDHNWVIKRKKKGFQLEFAAQLFEPKTGRIMSIFTTEPGIQFYAGNYLDSTIRGKKGRIYHHRYGLCLETQHFPDSPNQPQFPSTTLKPGETYRHKTVYAFTSKK